MFCPNCGTQNPDAAQTCSKCNFHLKSVAAPKFKGTMLMMNQALIPGAPPPGAPAPMPAPAPGMPGANPRSSSASGPPPGAAAPAMSSRLKGTMVGVAPMAGPGSPMPQGPGAPMPQGPGAPMGGAPMGGPMGGGTRAFGAQAPGTPVPPAPGMAPEMNSAFSPPVPQPGVNPLGGTMAADGSPFAAGFGGPGSPFGPPPGMQATAMMPNAGPPAYGQYGAPATGSSPPPAGSPYDAPNQYGAPPGGYGGSPGGYGATYAAPAGGYGGMPGEAPGQALAPYGQPQGTGLVPSMGQPLASATVGPRRRNALMTFLLPLAVIVAGVVASAVLAAISPALALLGSLIQLAGLVWYLVLAITMANEVKAVTRNEAFAWWPVLVPFYNLYWFLILVPQEVTKAKQILGVQAATRGLVVYFFLFPFALASDLNDMAR